MDKNILTQLEKITGKDGVLTSPEDLAVYGYDGTFEDHRPDVVVLPQTTEQVSRIVALAAAERIPVVTRGMGSGLAAASVPFQGGITLAMTRMNRIRRSTRSMPRYASKRASSPRTCKRRWKNSGCSIPPTRPATGIPPSEGISPAMRADRAASSTA
jgi:hypothetical protein